MNYEKRLYTVIKSIRSLDKAALFAEITSSRGPNKGSLRKSAPSSHLAKYVWRMVTFELGIDRSFPVMTQFYVQDYVDSVVGKQTLNDPESLFVYITTNGVSHIYSLLDSLVDEFVSNYNKVAA